MDSCKYVRKNSLLATKAGAFAPPLPPLNLPLSGVCFRDGTLAHSVGVSLRTPLRGLCYPAHSPFVLLRAQVSPSVVHEVGTQMDKWRVKSLHNQMNMVNGWIAQLYSLKIFSYIFCVRKSFYNANLRFTIKHCGLCLYWRLLVLCMNLLNCEATSVASANLVPRLLLFCRGGAWVWASYCHTVPMVLEIRSKVRVY